MIVSRLLQYPDDELMDSVAHLEEVLAEASDPRARRRGAEFREQTRKAPLIRLQEDYTRVFDLDPVTSLNLSYHKWGDDRRRALALVELNQAYQEAGYEAAPGELPDYLPQMLEFLAVGPEEARRKIAGHYGAQVVALGERLSPGPPWPFLPVSPGCPALVPLSPG